MISPLQLKKITNKKAEPSMLLYPESMGAAIKKDA
jgi:hypothetical protein